ncbi:hypothetical protein EDC04DRAFT_2606152 [Pisolithus marmoratus]|nr:hypothetical protein EDC04DRAFT_2606152 [Pisolithus marmoratus]
MSDKDENFDIDNVSSSSNEDDQMPDQQVCLVPLNDMNGPITPDPLLNTTHSGGKTAATFDVNYFFDHSKNLPSICKFCCVFEEYNNSYSLQELKSLVDRGVSLMNLPPHPVTPTPNLGSGNTNDDDRSSTPPFSITIFHKSLVNFIIADDQSLHVVKCKEFR